MTEYPPVIALIITYRRLALARETIRSVKKNVTYPNIGFHIADDGSGPEYVQALVEEIGNTYSVTISDAARGGVGKNMNLGVASVLQRADLWLHLEDDWVLHAPLDLVPCVQLLEEDASVGMVRLGRLTAGLKGETMAGANRMWWRLVKGSNTYIMTGNAALRHRRFADHYGAYKEGLSPGRTELSYCDQFSRARGGPDIVWPGWLSSGDVFQHIGDHQSFKWHMETGGHTAEEAAAIFEEMEREAAGVIGD